MGRPVKKSLLTIAAIGALIAGHAMAADMGLPLKAPSAPAQPTPTWTGWYVGINGGGSWGNTDPTVNAVNGAAGFFAAGNIPAVNAVGSTSFANSGGLVGGQAGYLFQTGKLISGLEVGLDYFGINGKASATGVYPLSPPGTPELFTFNENAKTDWLLTFLGRVGIDQGVWYPYVTGGAAVTRVNYSNTFVDNVFSPGCTTCTASIEQTKTGVAVGAGAEWLVSAHWLLRAEYLFVDLGSLSGSSPAFYNTAFPAFTASFNDKVTFNSQQIARLALSYKF
jgi:outer membrane immunogenic protein